MISRLRPYLADPRRLAFPERVTLELTNRCNLRCSFCPRHFSQSPLGDMDFDLFAACIEEIAGHEGVAMVPFFRGEPLLHPRFPEMMRYAKGRGIGPIQLATNGLLLSKEIARAILDLGLEFVSFSLDTLNQALYEEIRPGGEYQQVHRNVLRLLELRANHPHPRTRVQVSAVETERTRPFLPEFIDYWRDRADQVRIYPEHSADGKFGRLATPPIPGERRPCLKVLTETVIYWNGNVALCNHDWDRSELIGNVREQGIAGAWRGAAYHEVRRRHGEGRTHQDPTCKDCDHWQVYYHEALHLGDLIPGTGSGGDHTADGTP